MNRLDKDCDHLGCHGGPCKFPLAVREHPLVAEHLLTVEAPSQTATDEEIAGAARRVAERLPGMVALASGALPDGFTARIDPFVTGMRCAACASPVLEMQRVVDATRSFRDTHEIMLALLRRSYSGQEFDAAQEAQQAAYRAVCAALDRLP